MDDPFIYGAPKVYVDGQRIEARDVAISREAFASSEDANAAIQLSADLNEWNKLAEAE